MVVISIDQMRYDYLERFAPWYSQGGFNRFLKSGATFPNTHYLHAVTFTGPGHATIGSGKHPSEHGIIGNNWFERDSANDTKRWSWYFSEVGGYEPPVKTSPDSSLPMWYADQRGAPRYCVYDESVSASAGTTAGMSPWMLNGAGLGDLVKAKYPGARVIGLALKDRAAILMAGRNADAAYWFDARLPGFISSSYYHFDPKLFSFNSTVPGYIPESRQWNASPFIPPDDLKRVTFDPPEAWPLKNTKYGGTFPHSIKDELAFTYTPFATDMTFDFALWTIAQESLGAKTATPDVLFVSISPTDYYGHYYGPDSMEVADGMVRLDRALEQFLDSLDRRFGGRVVVALTADHGVQPTPEILKLREPGADTGRLDLRNPGRQGQRLSDLPALRLELEKRLAAKLGLSFSPDAPYSHALVYFFEEPSVYVNLDRVRELKLDRERVKSALRDVVMTLNGVARAWTDTELRKSTGGGIEAMMRRSQLQGRSGDVFVALKPNWIWSWGSNSTTHGQPVENDTRVPLLFWGTDIKSGRYDTAASPDDLVRTLGAIIGVQAGGIDAHVLPCLTSSSETETLINLALHALDPSDKTTREAVQIDPVKIEGDRATVRIWTGRPAQPPPAGTLSLDCGTGHTYVFEKRSGEWVLVSQGVAMC